MASGLEIGPGLARLADVMASTRTREAFVEGALRVLLDIGFERARFYELARDVISDEDVLVLTAEQPDEMSTRRRGEPLPFASASIRRDGDVFLPVTGRASEPGAARFGDRERWIEIPVTAGDAIVGIFACDWNRGGEDLAGGDISALRVLGVQAGSHLGLKPIAILESFRARREGYTETTPIDLVAGAMRDLAAVVDSAVTSVFGFSWPNQRLTKLDEHRAPGVSLSPPFRPESYDVGQGLTGRAWTDANVHHLISFRNFEVLDPECVEAESLAWHRELLGEVRSIMYAVVGALDRRYLLRMINRADRPDLPFLSEFSTLDTLLNELKADVDAAIANQRLQSLQAMTEVTAETTHPEKLVDEIADSLKAESVADFVVLCHQQESAQFGFGALRGPRLRRHALDLSREWGGDSLYADTVKAADPRVSRIADHQGGARSSLAALLRDSGFAAAWSFPIHTGQTRGIFLIPLDAVPPRRGKRRGFDSPPDCGFGTISLLHAYSRLLGNVLETRHSQAKSDGARRALGLMGHELRGPLAALGSAAELALNAALRAADGRDGEEADHAELKSYLQRQRQRLGARQRQVSVALELAPIVAEESEGTLQLHFRPTNLTALLKSAVDHVRAELDQERVAQRRYDFRFSQSCQRLGTVVCDPEYIRHVFKNVVRNAVKYSLPRRPPEPMAIELIGEPQSRYVGVKVRNWGFEIPDDKRDLIFEPWVRGDITDRMKAIRGMGLGLFLARRILASHGGEILYTSRFTLDDRSRMALHEGFETIFEIRIPLNLARGTYVHQWGDRSQAPRVAVS